MVLLVSTSQWRALTCRTPALRSAERRACPRGDHRGGQAARSNPTVVRPRLVHLQGVVVLEQFRHAFAVVQHPVERRQQRSASRESLAHQCRIDPPGPRDTVDVGVDLLALGRGELLQERERERLQRDLVAGLVEGLSDVLDRSVVARGTRSAGAAVLVSDLLEEPKQPYFRRRGARSRSATAPRASYPGSNGAGTVAGRRPV